MTTHHDDAAPATSATRTGDVAASFPEVLARELELITARRRVVLGDEAGTDTATIAAGAQVFANAQHTSALGLAFSGGGIRSGTFNLGVLQAVAENGLLKYVDYLSTVSGGATSARGCTGSCTAARRTGRRIRR